jgi:uncharacterized RDD family membrane protein YckC
MNAADVPTRPESGPGSVAGIGTRLRAFVVDSLLSVAIALLAGYRPGHPGYDVTVWASFLAIELLFIPTVGQTPGMRVAGAHRVGGVRPACTDRRRDRARNA